MSLSEFRDRAARRQVRAYLDFFAPVTAQFLPDLADRLATPQGPALDLGCGDGELARSLRARGWQVIAVDRSPEMARTAHAASGADVVVADATALPVRGAALGALGAAFVLPHLPDLSRGLAEARRVLRPGGCLAMTGWAAPSLSPLTGLLADLVLAHTSEAAALIEAQRRSDGDYLRQALGVAGFADITVETLA
ncbi:MAG TPA: class I SAM-dependent methyltransferase, partial [Micromonosporaceae bacterium]